MLERSCKDLQRQTVSLERLRVVLGDNVDKAFRRVNEVFRELHEQSVSALLLLTRFTIYLTIYRKAVLSLS